MRRSAPIRRAVLLAGLLLPAAADAHPLAPALLELREGSGGEVELRFKQPVARVPGAGLALEPLAGCAVHARAVVPAEAGSRLERLRLRCDPPGLAGREIGVAGIAESQTDVVLRVEPAGGPTLRSLLTAARPRWRIPARESAAEVLAAYGRLGVAHILGGLDHLLFVLGLALLAGSARRLLWTVTAFTAGHSVTLALASLGRIPLASGAIEVGIAASLLFLAVELTREGAAGAPVRRVPVPLAFAFGLLHGMGFAGALRDVGLPANAIPLALFAFNAGIELGQIGFVALLAAPWSALRRRAAAPPARALRRASAYGIGCAAAFWMFERLAAHGVRIAGG